MADLTQRVEDLLEFRRAVRRKFKEHSHRYVDLGRLINDEDFGYLDQVELIKMLCTVAVYEEIRDQFNPLELLPHA